MNNNDKKHLAERLDQYFNNKKSGIPVITGEFLEQNNDTIKGSIYNKIFKNQIEMQKLEQQYIHENKEIDITKASKRIKELNEKIEKTKTTLNNFSKEYQEEIEKAQDEELKNESSVMNRISIINKYNNLLEGMQDLPVYQNLTTELNDYNVELYMLQTKLQEFEQENDALIKEIQRNRQKEKVEQYLQSKEI